MDDDDFGGDIDDEDLMLALETASTPIIAKPTTTTTTTTALTATGTGHATVPRATNDSNNLRRPPAAQPRTLSRGPSFTRPFPPAADGTGNSFRNEPQGQLQIRAPVAAAQPAVIDLDDLPSDAFDSSLASLHPRGQTQQAILAGLQQNPPRSSGQPGSSFRQRTLFGDTLPDGPSQPASSYNNHAYLGDRPPERPTHHRLKADELKTWVYPTNLGPIREYQFSIVKNSLFHNTLVALPTGLGKTFIAATVILNFYRWTADAKMVFVAPTKPLVSQQVDACFHVAGIPRSETTLLTGETAPALRAAEWASKRLFFMTPQTLQNDLSKGYADPKSIVLLVIDEAHRATGDYAYVKVIGFLRRFQQSFRVLALTATPGSTVKGVQDVIDNLGVSHVEIRTEESLDLRSYVHARGLERVTLDPSVEIRFVQERLSKALKPLCDKLDQQRIWYGRDPMSLTAYGLMRAKDEWAHGPGRHLNQGTQNMIRAVFSVLQSLAHAIKLLNFHGIRPFYDNMEAFRQEQEAQESKKPGGGSKYRRQILQDPDFQEMMLEMERWMGEGDAFESHPKIGFLKERLRDHFEEAAAAARQDSNSSSSGGATNNTRAIVFSEFRDSAEEIVRTLNRSCGPLIKAAVFVGQADSKRSTGMKQKQQIEAIEKFKNGEFNVLVATSIGEEGLDIGQVDLIICYDASASPIRMLQRMGRTGRKRDGHVILLLMRGREEQKFAEAQDNYTRMQQLICDGSQFNFRFDMSERIVPREIKPVVDKRWVDIPVENTQDVSLPEPRRGAIAARAVKKAPKKTFHMPDNVETGFVKASAVLDGFVSRAIGGSGSGCGGSGGPPRPPSETDVLADIPDLERAVGRCQASCRTAWEADAMIDPAQSEYLRALRPTKILRHGDYTARMTRLVSRLSASESELAQAYESRGSKDSKDAYLRIPVPKLVARSDGEEEEESSEPEFGRKKTTAARASFAFTSASKFTPSPLNAATASPSSTAKGPVAKRRRVGESGNRGSAMKGLKGPKERAKLFRSFFGVDDDDDDDDDDGDGGRGARYKKDEDDEEDDDEDSFPMHRSKTRGRSAIKGLTKQRSSQWQSYHFDAVPSRPLPSSRPAAATATAATTASLAAARPTTKPFKPPSRRMMADWDSEEDEVAKIKEEEADEKGGFGMTREEGGFDMTREGGFDMPREGGFDMPREERRRSEPKGRAEPDRRQKPEAREEDLLEDPVDVSMDDMDAFMDNPRDKPMVNPMDDMDDAMDDCVEEPVVAARMAVDSFRAHHVVPTMSDDNEPVVIQVQAKPKRGRGRGRGRGGGTRGARAAGGGDVAAAAADNTTGDGGRGRGKGKTRGRGRGRGRTSLYAAGRGRLEDRGDDCMRTSDNYESDGSDSGGDLVDFIVDDEEDDGIVDDDDDEEEEPEYEESPRRTKRKSSSRNGRPNDASKSKAKSKSTTNDSDNDSRPRPGGRRRGLLTSSPASSPPIPKRLPQVLDSGDNDSNGNRRGHGVGKRFDIFARKGPLTAASRAARRAMPIDDIEDSDDDNDDDNEAFDAEADRVFAARRPARRRRPMADSDSDE